MYAEGGKGQQRLLAAFVAMGALVWMLLFVSSLRAYPGSAAVYIFFSLVFLALLLSAFYRQQTYVYIFLAVLLWLGFWSKLAWSLVGAIHLPEPVGRFVPIATNWDEVLLVATAAAAALLVSHVLWGRLAGWLAVTGQYRVTLRAAGVRYPAWLAHSNRWGLVLFVGVTLGLVGANVHWGIAMVGVQTQTVLPWPLNAVISLMLMGGGGLCVWAGAMIWWQAAAQRPIFFYVAIYTVSAALVAAGSLSRATVVAYALPLLYAMYLNRRAIVDFSWVRFLFICLLFGTTLLAGFSVVNQLRAERYFSTVTAERNQPQLFLGEEINRFLGFSVGRWVGIEGLMAVSAWPDKGLAQLGAAIVERPQAGKMGLYQQVAPFPKSEQMKSGVVFNSIPGGVGFLYYSGSVLVLFALTLLISLMLQAAETLIYRLTTNPFICASTGYLMAMLFVQQWGMPYYVIVFMGYVGACITLVTLLQSRWLLRRLGLGVRARVDI
ncbi:MAG: hypothetical protein RJB34_562 [Pseudomonadota bacterium]